ncbi:GcrA family cell cycle regulator [Agrobacterium tumefaciens]|uniref:GcrA family cell cycle regulator n=1 Tax=Agrobacterium tumefaciens TaxID=358 RepID=UPI001CBF314F|nr:GcrA family cell cycle regulator [Agrobacterium tumefaciens]
MNWTDERVSRLLELWHSGASALSIAEALGGVSVAAVEGKIYRLGLGRRSNSSGGTDLLSRDTASEPQSQDKIAQKWSTPDTSVGRFWDDLPKGEVQQASLPLFHTTESVVVRDIAGAMEISTTHCDVYDEELVYFFYGRPGYRPSTSKLMTNHIEYYPVVLVITPDAVKSIRRMLPFDSGGYHTGRFEDFHHPKMKKEAFHIPPPIGNLESVISFFFGSSDQYVRAAGRTDLTPPPTKFELSTFYRMVHGVQKSQSDDRRLTCEVQSDAPFPLNGENVIAVIAPAVFEDEPYFTACLDKLGCQFKGYEADLANSSEMHALISHLVREALKEWTQA